jgi:hypothetical protein
MEPKKKYKLRVKVGEEILTYSAEIISIENGFVKFLDKFGNVLNYNLNSIVYYEEVE